MSFYVNGGGGGWTSWVSNATSASTQYMQMGPYSVTSYEMMSPPVAVPEPEKPRFDTEIEWLRGRVQEVVDIFDRAAA